MLMNEVGDVVAFRHRITRPVRREVDDLQARGDIVQRFCYLLCMPMADRIVVCNDDNVAVFEVDVRSGVHLPAPSLLVVAMKVNLARTWGTSRLQQ
jgi:hypothetical protein